MKIIELSKAKLYAKVIIQQASINYLATTVLPQLQQIVIILQEPKIASILRKAKCRRLLQQQLVQDLLSSWPEQLSILVINLLKLLAYNKRLFLLWLIAQQVQSLIWERTSVIQVKVRTAIVLSKEQTVNLQQYWQQRTKANQVDLVISVEPELIGGLVMQYKDTLVDASILGRLQQWQNLAS